MKAIVMAAAAALMMSVPVLASESNPTPQNPGGILPVMEQGVGPVMSGSVDLSQLPEPAMMFLAEYYPGVTVVECEKEFLAGRFDVELVNGTDLEFDSEGNWIEIEAPQNGALSAAMLKELLPAKAYDKLVKEKAINYIESVKRSERGYEVEMSRHVVDEFNFAIDGRLLGQSR